MKTNLFFIIAILTVGGAASAQEKLPTEEHCLSVLRSDAGVQQKARACQQLSIVGTGESVDVLAALLGDANLSDYARFALEQIDDERVDEAFRNALAKVKGRQLAGIISSIGARQDTRAVPALERLILDNQSGVSREAVAALGRIATDEAIATIGGVLAAVQDDLRISAAQAALTAGQRLMARGENEKAVAVFNRVLLADVPGHIKNAAAYNSILAGGDSGITLLAEQLRSDDPGKVEMALLAARKLRGSAVSQKLAAEVPNLSPAIQVLTIKALLDRDDPSVAGVIRQLAESNNRNVRTEALKALGQIGDSSAVAILLTAADAGGGESEIALASLRTIQADDIEQQIIACMQSANAPLKAKLIEIIAARRFSAAVAALLTEAANKNETVAIAALKALTELAGPQDLPALVSLLLNIQDARVRSQAEVTAAAVALKKPDKSKQADEVTGALNGARDLETRLSLLRVLGRIGNGTALGALQTALDSDSEAIRDTAIRALAGCPNADALDTLLRICDTAANDTHRILALRGYIRLLGTDDSIAGETKAGLYAKALERAASPAEKRLAIGGLAQVSHPDALNVVAAVLDDPTVRKEAILAALAIAQRTAGASPDLARNTALKIEQIAVSPDIKTQAQTLARTIDGFGDFIVAWQVTDFYTEAYQDHNSLLWSVFEPETPNSTARWSLLPAGTDPERPWMLDLLRLYPGDNRVAYVRTWIYSEQPQDAILELGSDDGVKAWLNGQLIHNHSVARAATPASDKVNISLKSGLNLLMLKISQNTAQWEFCAKITNARNIRVTCLPK